MLFGLVNALATFRSYINKCLAEKLDIFCVVYLDDILIYTNKKGTKHEKGVRWVLEKLWKYCLYLNLKKCRFSIDEIYFWEYIVSPSGVQIEPEQIESIKNWLEPQFIREIQVFITFANFYRWIIRNFSAIAWPFTSMSKTCPGSKSSKLAKKDTVIPTPQGSATFSTQQSKEYCQKLKKSFFGGLVLQHFDWSKLIRL